MSREENRGLNFQKSTRNIMLFSDKFLPCSHTFINYMPETSSFNAVGSIRLGAWEVLSELLFLLRNLLSVYNFIHCHSYFGITIQIQSWSSLFAVYLKHSFPQTLTRSMILKTLDCLPIASWPGIYRANPGRWALLDLFQCRQSSVGDAGPWLSIFSE